jgi:hypothetical protein
MPNRRIEVLTFDGCPNANAAQALVDRVVAGLGVEAEVASIRVPDVDAAERFRFLGSPTIRVDARPGIEVARNGRKRTYTRGRADPNERR